MMGPHWHYNITLHYLLALPCGVAQRFNPDLLTLIPASQLDAALEGGAHEYEFEHEVYWRQLCGRAGVRGDGSRYDVDGDGGGDGEPEPEQGGAGHGGSETTATTTTATTATPDNPSTPTTTTLTTTTTTSNTSCAVVPVEKDDIGE